MKLIHPFFFWNEKVNAIINKICSCILTFMCMECGFEKIIKTSYRFICKILFVAFFGQKCFLMASVRKLSFFTSFVGQLLIPVVIFHAGSLDIIPLRAHYIIFQKFEVGIKLIRVKNIICCLCCHIRKCRNVRFVITSLRKYSQI